MMKIFKYFLLSIFCAAAVYSQPANIDMIYNKAMEAYNKKNYNESAELFDRVFEISGYEQSSSTRLYNGACTYALSRKINKSLEILNYLADKKFYSNLNHINSDTDFKQLHSMPEWQTIIEKVKQNVSTLPLHTKAKVKTELLKAKAILKKDNGNLWGEQIWSDAVIILDQDNTIYSLSKLPESKTDDSVVYYKKVPPNTIYQSNTTQLYNGEKFAVIQANYLNDSSSTIIHELFHVLQDKQRAFNGDPINYLDEHDARQWLRLEYQALRNSLQSIIDKKEESVIAQYLNDACLFRKLRQSKYKDYLEKELSIETLEGMANYTGHKLSSNPDKYNTAIKEINQRESSSSFTRPFSYATGLAYGLLFDYLNINWKAGIDTIYNFCNIYESIYLKKAIDTSIINIEKANKRNNYEIIHKEELERKQTYDKNIAFYTNLFVIKPVLTVVIQEPKYTRSFDMNGTLVLQNLGMVYTLLTGTDESGNKNFGNFKTYPEKNELGVYGVLGSFDGTKITFPLPLKIDGKKIFGENYEIELNDGWEVKKVNEKGDLKIIKQN